MSDTVNQIPASDRAASRPLAGPAAADPTTDGPLGRMRLMPSVSFGLRAAALTSIALPVVVMATNLAAHGPAGAADAVMLGTTCCPAG